MPKLICDSSKILEYPMVDRDPVENWTIGNVSLMGDAAHATYPVGSSGASQAIVDSRKLGSYFLKCGINKFALKEYQKEVLPLMNNIILANRKAGPDAKSWARCHITNGRRFMWRGI